MTVLLPALLIITTPAGSEEQAQLQAPAADQPATTEEEEPDDDIIEEEPPEPQETSCFPLTWARSSSPTRCISTSCVMLECYHYVNFFETKGVEYVLVIIFLISLLAFARLLARPTVARDAAHAPAKEAPETSGACVAQFRCPYKLQEEENA